MDSADQPMGRGDGRDRGTAAQPDRQAVRANWTVRDGGRTGAVLRVPVFAEGELLCGIVVLRRWRMAECGDVRDRERGRGVPRPYIWADTQVCPYKTSAK